MNEIHVRDFMDEFVEELNKQLKDDEGRWGNTWLNRTRLGQEERTFMKFNDYFDQYFNVGTPVPWLKIVGNAMICWIREKHPELWEE